MKEIIKLSNVNKIFLTEEVETKALKEINLSIHQGEYVSISGPSGCGKSTLLSVLGLLDILSSGSFSLNSFNVENLNSGQRAKIRNENIGFIFQSFNLISNLTVAENVELPLSYRSSITKAKREELMIAALKTVNLLDRKNHYPNQLSGGQQQRVAIARAIIGKPTILLADEPTGNLDSKNAANVMELLAQLHKNGTTICMVTHDPRSAEHAERIIEMLDGQIISDSKLTSEKVA